jgi:ribonuclease HI
MEIYAAIAGLEVLKYPCRVTIYSDSQYLVRAMSEGWVEKWKSRNWWRTNKDKTANADLRVKLSVLCETHEVTFVWVEGHSGNPENEKCDKLSYAALRQKDLPPDELYDNPPPALEPMKMTKAGQPCRKCSTPVIKLKSKKFKFYLFCPNYKATYELEFDKEGEYKQAGFF